MNINPLPYDEREHMIAFLAQGLGPRAAETLRGLSDGALRTCHESWVAEERRLRELHESPRMKAPSELAEIRGIRVNHSPVPAPAPELQPR